MQLLEIEDIRSKLTSHFRGAPPELAGLTLQDSNLTSQDLNALETALGLKLPTALRKLIGTYNFGNLSFAGVFFGNSKRYDQFLLKMNENPEYPWWGHGVRPAGHLLVAGTDGYVLIVEPDGSISAYLRDEDWSHRGRVATDFELVLRACGTLFFEKSPRNPLVIAKEIAELAGGDPNASFWPDRIEGLT